MPNAIYPASKKSRAARPFALQIKFYSRGIFSTKKVYADALKGGSVDELTDAGIRLPDCSYFPAVTIRIRSNSGSSPTVILSHAEAEALARNFALPVEVIAGAYYRQVGGLRVMGGELKIVPRWRELLEPDWRSQFAGWLGNDQPVPVPAALPWQTLPGGNIAMPTLPRVMVFNEARKRIIRGELRLEEGDRKHYAAFRYGAEEKRYALTPESFTLVGAMSKGVTFDRVLIKELFQPYDRAEKSVVCSRLVVRDNLINLVSLSGESLRFKFLLSSGVTPGMIVHFRLSRLRTRIFVEAFADQKMELPIGRLNIGLNSSGVPSSMRMQYTFENITS